MKKKSLLIAASALLASSVYAANGDKFEIDGLVYTILSEADHTVSVKSPDYTYAVSGHLNIPATVTNDDIVYTITTLPAVAFQYCNHITSVDIPATVTNIATNSFYRCTALTDINVDENNPAYTSSDGVLYNNDMTELISCPNAKSGGFNIPQSVTTISTNGFNGCTELTSITIPDGVTAIGGNAFYLCTSIKSIHIPAAVTHTATSPNFFGRCSSLEEITVDPENKEYCSVDGVLYSKDMTTLVQYPVARQGDVILPESVTSLSDFSFSDCEALTTVNIPARIANIGGGAYSYCPNITEFIVDENNPSYCSVDGVLYNKAQTTLTLYPNARTGSFTVPGNIATLSTNAFRGAGISSIVIPATVSAMSGQTFQDCSNLSKMVDLKPQPQSISYATIHGTPSSMIVYVPAGCKEAYEKAWPAILNIEEINDFVVVISAVEMQMTIGETADLKADIVSTGDVAVKTRTWSSSNPSVATVDESGKVTAIADGSATITVAVTDENDQTRSDMCEITISPKADIIEIVADPVEAINYSTPLDVYDLSGKKVSNSVSNLSPGIYVVHQGSKTAKIAIE
ncbi:MAG: leucine-rich repeat protein [Paramuribaculum sp.]|nr:leucine-rich repeat protein [Paramuribaculum sp.]